MKITYRPEIDGLRAIAVLAVITYHFKIDNVLQGGYLGVDIFFVISGFLISSIILKELSTTGSFSFINFYKRRIRRLIPVLLVVIITSTITAWFILLPTQLISFAKSAIASIFFLSNQFWYSSSFDYEAQSSLLEPLLHTWTLSVEEQFYLLFPCLLFFGFKFIKKRLLSVFLFLTIVSLLFAQVYLNTDKSFCFYLLPTRLWELSAGCIIALLNFKKINVKPSRTFIKNIPSICLVIIILCFIFFNDETPHPGLMTSIPILATLGILLYSHPRDASIRLLSSKPLVFIGLLSYSLYLWHYPVFAFGRNITFETSPFQMASWAIITFILSYFSFRFIEQPFRDKNTVNSKLFTYSILPLLVICVAASYFIIQNNGYPQRFKNIYENYFGNEVDNSVLKEQRNAYFDKVFSDTSFDQGKTNVLIIGDSHSKDLFLSFYLNKELFEDYSFHRIGFNGWIDKKNNKLYSDKFVENADVVIICNRFANKTWIFENLEGFIKFLQNQNKRVMIALNTAEFYSYGRVELFDQFIMNSRSVSDTLDDKKINNFFYKNRREHIPIINDSILNFAKKMKIEYLDRYSLVCDDSIKECYGTTPNAKKAYADGSHLSLDGAKFYGKEFYKKGGLIKINYVDTTFTTSSTNLETTIQKLREKKELEKIEIYKKRKELKLKLNDKNLSPEERKKLKEKERLKLKKEWKEAKSKKNKK